MKFPPKPEVVFAVTNRYGEVPTADSGDSYRGFKVGYTWLPNFGLSAVYDTHEDCEGSNYSVMRRWRNACLNTIRNLDNWGQILVGRTIQDITLLDRYYSLHRIRVDTDKHVDVQAGRYRYEEGQVGRPEENAPVKRLLANHRTIRLENGQGWDLGFRTHFAEISDEFLDELIENSD